MSYDDQNTTFGSRGDAFGQGLDGGDSFASSLDATSARWNAETPHQFTPQSVLSASTAMLTGNGLSERDAAERRLYGPTLLPTGNGTSQATNKDRLPLILTKGI